MADHENCGLLQAGRASAGIASLRCPSSAHFWSSNISIMRRAADTPLIVLGQDTCGGRSQLERALLLEWRRDSSLRHRLTERRQSLGSTNATQSNVSIANTTQRPTLSRD